MTRIIYANGLYRPRAEASISPEERAFLFGDAVYEVCEVRGTRIVDETRHLARLQRSLGELRTDMPMSPAALGRVMREIIRRNRVRDGMVFLQVGRGKGKGGREFLFPDPPSRSTLVCWARSLDPAAAEKRAKTGIGVKTVADTRWARCDIKTVMLLAACLAKEEAKAEGSHEAWFVDTDGHVTEGASSNAWILDSQGRLVTRQADRGILRGVTRTTLLDVLSREGLELREAPFTVAEAQAAREAFVSSATTIVLPVVRIDGVAIGDGKPGPVSRRLRGAFHAVAEVAKQ